MIKLLQKYKMYVLVVAGVFIMISFLLADALRQLNAYSMENERLYTIDGQKVSRGDAQRSAYHFEGLKRTIDSNVMKRFQLDDDSTQWLLAAAAADRAGLVGGPADGRTMAQQIVTENLMREYGTAQFGYGDWKKNMTERTGLSDEQTDARISQLADTLLATAGRTGNAAYEGANALAEYRGVLRLMQSYANVPQTSENRMAAEARRLLDVAVLRYAFVPLTEARIAAAPAPTPEEMKAQFEKFKDTPVGAGENGVGYRQNDRVAYTWFAIDRAAVSKAVKVDPVDVQKRIMAKNPDGKVDPAVRKQIENEIRAELTQRTIDDITTALRAEFLRGSVTLSEKDGYKALPPDWVKPDLAAAVAAAYKRVDADRKTSLPVPQVHTVATPQDARTFGQEKGIGVAMLARPSQQAVYLRDVLFSAKELGKPAGKFPAQVGLPIATPFTGPDGELCFVMLDSALPAASPAGLQEVAAQVEKDLRRASALEKLKADIESVMPPIVNLGMSEAPAQLEKLGYPGITVQGGLAQRFLLQNTGQGIYSEQGVPAPREVQNPGYIDAVLDRAAKLDPSLKVGANTASDRTFAYALRADSPAGTGVILTQITGLRPLTREMFSAVLTDARFRMVLETKDMTRAASSPFKTDALVKRLNVTGIEHDKNAPGDGN